MDNAPELNIAIYNCTFTAHVETANVLIKFPCQYFLEWKTANGKKVAEGKGRPIARNSLVEFNETLQLSTEMVLDRATGKFLKKETLLNLNLISKARQDQVKLIGRVAIDLADIANRQEYQRSRPYKLSYCSVDAELTFSAVLQNKRETNMNPQDLDRSSFNDYLSFYSCKQTKNKLDAAVTEPQENSIGYTRQTQEHAIDIPVNQRHSRPFNQTFFMFSSPKPNRTRQVLKTARENPSEPQRTSNIRSQIGARSPSGSKEINNSRSTQLTTQLTGRIRPEDSNRIQEEQTTWQKEKNRFRGEIDGNREKIEELQRKIMELTTNLEDSKRHLQFTERQNRQKEQIIKILKQSQFKTDSEANKKQNNLQAQKSNQNLQLKQLQEKLERLTRDKENDERQWKSKEDIYKGQIIQFQASIDLLRKQTDEFRKMWQQKRDHFEEKIKVGEGKLKEKQLKINQLNTKLQDLLKYKYQYQILKELNDEKDEKLKNTEKSLNKLKFQIQQINKNNYAEEIYKLKLQIAHLTKSNQELTLKYAKSDEEITKYKESYIKIETAYQIQGKNYDSCKEKNNQNEVIIYNLQKDNIQLKNNLNNTVKTIQELNLKLANAHDQQILQQKIYEQLHKEQKKVQTELENSLKEKEQLRSTIQRLRIQLQAKNRDFEDKIKRIQTTIINAQEQKERHLKQQQARLSSCISQLQTKKQQLQLNRKQLQETITHLQSSILQLRQSSESQIKNRETTIANLQSVITDKQEIIKMCNNQLQNLRQSNKQLTETLTQMNIKEKQLQENITILEEQSHKILYILEQKEQLDKQLEQLQINYKDILEKNQLNIKIIQQQRRKNEQKAMLIEEKDRKLMENQTKIQELSLNMTKYSQTLHNIQQQISEKELILHQKQSQIQTIQSQLHQSKSSLEVLREQLSHALQQAQKSKQIIREINERYEQHLKNQQRYHLQLSIVRQEKQELEVYISKNNNEFALYNEELESRIVVLQKDIDRLEHQAAFAEQERKHFEEKCIQMQNEKKEMSIQMQRLKQQILRFVGENRQSDHNLSVKLNDYEEIKAKILDYESRLHKLQQQLQESKIQLQNTKIQNQRLRILLQEKTIQLEKNQQSLQIIESDRNNLTHHIQNLQEQIYHQSENRPQIYNQLIEIQEQMEVQAARSIIQQRRVVDQDKYDELNFLLAENEQKVRTLQQKIEQLNLQIRNLVYQLQKKAQKNLFEEFPQFHREQMSKIIEQQRKEIDRLQAENKMKASRGSAVLQNRIRQLQTNIVELESSFRMEIDRILSGHNNKETNEGALSVINQQVAQDIKSERSISVAATPNRVKQSFDSAEGVDLREKFAILQEEKLQLQSQLQASQEQKFNLMSTINQKQIILEETLRVKLLAEMEIQQLKRINQNARIQLQSLSAEIQSLRNQVNFGTSIILNDQSVTRSQPIISEQTETHNKDIEIEHLRAEIEKGKAREQELAWNIRDLQMQLETVTQNLNLLNGSSMNSFLNGSGKSNQEQPQHQHHAVVNTQFESGYSKERLLQSLKRNQDLKLMAHNIIRALKQREKQAQEQQKLLKDLNSNRAIINSAINSRNTLKFQAICKKVPSLFKQFQALKMQVARLQNTLQSNHQGPLKGLLIFQQKLKQLRLLSQGEQSSIGDY